MAKSLKNPVYSSCQHQHRTGSSYQDLVTTVSDLILFYLLQLQVLQLYTIFTRLLNLVTKYIILHIYINNYSNYD